MKKISLKVFLLFLNFLIIISIYFYNRQIYSNDKSTEYTNVCDPLIPNAKPTSSVVIDGVRYPRITPLYLNTSINFDCLNNKQSKPKLILAWNQRHGHADFAFGLGKYTPFKKRKCPVVNCEFTNNRSRVNESDMILFCLSDDIDELPKWRQPHQHWVFFLIESPHLLKYSTKNYSGLYDNLFNLSATYRLDSDFTPAYYTLYIWSENEAVNDVDKNFLQNKTNFAVAIISHCSAESKRDNYIQELQKYVPVDVFGKCGKPCPIPNDTWLGIDCKKHLSKTYKFFFAFENSFCKDYVTEKFFETLKFDMIPVVYGADIHHMFIPKSGYINALDFQTPKHLAEYLLNVASDTDLYNSFFQWKKYVKTGYFGGQICEMCIMLNLERHFGIKQKTIGKMDEFWNYRKDCLKMNVNKTFTLEPQF